MQWCALIKSKTICPYNSWHGRISSQLWTCGGVFDEWQKNKKTEIFEAVALKLSLLHNRSADLFCLPDANELLHLWWVMLT